MGVIALIYISLCVKVHEKYYFLLSYFLLSSCMNHRRIDIVSHNISYFINMPKRYHSINLIGGHNEIEKQLENEKTNNIPDIFAMCI